MPNAARITDETSHGGFIIGPGCPTVLIAGFPAATVGATTIGINPSNGLNVPSTFPLGSTTVLISGLPALRQGDTSINGATIVTGSPTVIIN